MAARAFARVAPVRAKVSLVAVVVLAMLLAVRLGDVQIRQGPKLAHVALLQHDETVESFAKRGAILDRDGGVLVRSLPSESIYAVPTEVDRRARSPRASSRRCCASRRPRSNRRCATRCSSAGSRARCRTTSPSACARSSSPGIGTKGEETGLRFVASGRLASTVVGFTGTDENGLDGLEYSFDKLLRGTPGPDARRSRSVRPRDPVRRNRRSSSAPSPARRSSRRSTRTCSSRPNGCLRACAKKWSARSATAIVMDPWTGELLAVANVPDFDPSHFGSYSPTRGATARSATPTNRARRSS